MDVIDAVCLWAVHRRMRRRRQMRERKYWVHPILKTRLSHSLYVTLYPKLREHDEKFFNYFRMSIKSFDDLLEIIKDSLEADENAIRYCISPQEKLIVTIRYLSTGCSITDLHYNYKIGVSTLTGIIRQVCQIIWIKLKNTVMSEPNKQKWLEISTGFEKRANFPNCIGALDGKHIRITQPPDSGSIYYNYKNFFSLVLMALCDSNYCFVWVDIGGYGKDSDSGLYKESTLYKKLTEKKLDIPDPKPLIIDNEDTKVPFVIVADEAFGMTENLMRPYGGKMLSYEKKIFNYRLTLARRYVECTFGIMCSKWRILHRPLDVKIDFAEAIVKAICTLHNYVRVRDGFNYEDTLYTPPLSNLSSTYTGRHVRDADMIRNKFTNYFTNEGKLEWQDKMI
ncbi:protein ALP1-like [Acyrthosiphon pisum]|uniref:DDE Tnp4 domain-containing protein n=2 Tax=Macrosiphini TaxID=33386 RepID=A0A8R2NQG8_ACYPI|nr:protein ALP1-like [Acyrthosiphon pisum]